MGHPHTDTELAHAIRSALAWDVFIPQERVQSTVSDGVVTLRGEVDDCSQREAAERAVRDLAGVKAVANLVQVKALPVAAGELAAAIEEALARQAEREARRIQLDIHDGCVKVSGTVHSWAEREAVVGAAKESRGVRAVESLLRIQPCA